MPSAARRSTAAASAEPPPSPAATGMCFSIVDAHAVARPSRSARERRAARPRPGWVPRPPGTRPRRLAARSPPARPRPRACIGLNSEQISCSPSARLRSDVEAEVELCGRAGGSASAHARRLPRQLRRTPARLSRLGALRRRVADAPRARRRGARARSAPPAGQLDRARQRLAPVRERGAHERPPARRAPPGRCAAARTAPSRRSARAGRRCARSARTNFTSQACCTSTDGMPYVLDARRRGQPVGDLALHHHAPRPGRRAAPRSCAGSPARGDAVGKVRDHLVRRRIERRRGRGPSRRRSSSVALLPVASASCSTGSSARSVSTTCSWRHARREVCAEHAEAAADLQHDVVRIELGGAADHARACCRRSGSSGPARGWAVCRMPATCRSRLAPDRRSPVEQARRVVDEQVARARS